LNYSRIAINAGTRTSHICLSALPVEPNRQPKNEKTACNSSRKKLAVQWLTQVQLFNRTFVQVDSFARCNLQFIVAANS
jgi:hypothetical protein